MGVYSLKKTNRCRHAEVLDSLQWRWPRTHERLKDNTRPRSLASWL